VVRADEVGECVASELLSRSPGELERDRCLGDDRECLDRGGVARSGCMSVGRGFIAARMTISSPFEMPASIPPARFVSR
jgi:hypothetical protein